jgi:ABC-type transport system involved in multi-copper enzyme maturation permease subunit
LIWVVAGALTIACCLIVNLLGQPEDAGVSFPRSLSTLHALLWVAWCFQGIYLPYAAAQAIIQTRETALLEWWMAEGLSSWKITLAQSLAILSWNLIYLLGVVSPLAIWLLRMQGAIPWRLLGEHHVLYLMSAELLTLFSAVLGTCFDPIISALAGSGVWLMAVLGGEWIPGILPLLPTSLRGVAGWFWYLLPQFELFHRPLSLVYHWPPLAGTVLASLVGYALGYMLLVLVGSEAVYRPRYD